jgi:hypothetical protein
VFETGPVAKVSPQAQATRRWIAVAIGLLVIAAITGGVLGKSVLVDSDVGMSMRCGLRSCDACADTACITTSTIQLAADVADGGGKASGAWGYSGAIGWWAAIVAALGIALATVMVAAGKYVRIPLISPTTLGLVGGAVALIAGCVFIATKPDGVGVTEVGWTFWSFGLGSVGAIVAAFMLSRQLAVIEPEFDPGDSPDAPADEPWQDP